MIPGYNPLPSARREGLEKANETKTTRYSQILEVLGDRKMTIREIAEDMYKRGMIRTPARQEIAPRITEMLQDGRIEPAYEIVIRNGEEYKEWKRYDDLTGVRVSMYERRGA